MNVLRVSATVLSYAQTLMEATSALALLVITLEIIVKDVMV